MIFTAYPDEANIIDKIQKIQNNDYVLVRMTYTMIDKNNIDTNELYREMLLKLKLVDYDKLKNGGSNGIAISSKFIYNSQIEDVKFNFYKVNNKRGDRRFSIERIKNKSKDKLINIGDLIYISYFKNTNNKNQLFFVNLTTNTPNENILKQELGLDPITQKFEEIKPLLKCIIEGGPYENSKGVGPVAPKDVGDTLESLLKVQTNNNPGADLDGLIELKTKSAKTLDTLFTLRPNFENTPVANYEENDRNRVSAFARLYGYDSEKHPGYNSLYITIGSETSPQNNQGFYLEVDDNEQKVNLMHISNTKKSEITAFWNFVDLKKQLFMKHPSTLWIKAETLTQGNITLFKYNSIEFSREPQFMTFLSLIKEGIITYDWRGYTTKSGNYSGKNHGNAWRIKPKMKYKLFGEIEEIKL